MSNFDYAGMLTEFILLGNIAIRRQGKKLEWDGPNMKFPNAPEADRWLKRGYPQALDGLTSSPRHSEIIPAALKCHRFAVRSPPRSPCRVYLDLSDPTFPTALACELTRHDPTRAHQNSPIRLPRDPRAPCRWSGKAGGAACRALRCNP